MEGTIHEKAVLVLMAYFIGFLTAFIWLTPQPAVDSFVTYIPDETMTASLVSATALKATESVTEGQTEKPAVSYHDGVLEVSVFGSTKVLSLNPDITGHVTDNDFLVQGTHVGNLVYTVSGSEEFVFFCEQKKLDAKTCSPFIFDALSDTIHPVTFNGDKIELLSSAVENVAWNNNILQVENEVSKDTLKPWLLGY